MITVVIGKTVLVVSLDGDCVVGVGIECEEDSVELC